MAYKVNTLGDLKGLPEDIVNQIRAQVTEDGSSVTSDPSPVRKSATEALREQQRAILARDQRPADKPTSAPPTDPPTEADSEPFKTGHPVFCALMLSKLVYGQPKADYLDKGRRVVITLEGGLRLHVDLQLWTVRYQAGQHFGPLRPVTPLTLDERIALRKLVAHEASIRD